MESLKKFIFLIFLVCCVFVAPLKTNALTVEELNVDLNSLLPINIDGIKSAVSYDYQKDIEEINSILDDSLNSSNYANDKLIELNILMNSINEDNKALLSIKEKEEYDESVDALKEKVEEAKQINEIAKNSSHSGLEKYNEALVKYVSLKSLLEERKEEAETILNNNISTAKTKLDIINDLLEELEKNENKLKEAYTKATDAYERAKENANVANNNFSEKLEELKKYVEVNSEQELNDLIQANTEYISSGVLYATSQIALKLIDIEIELVEAEIAGLEADLALLDEQLAPLKEELDQKESELKELEREQKKLRSINEIDADIDNANNSLTALQDANPNIDTHKAICSNYIGELKNPETTAKLIETLLENIDEYGFANKDLEVTTKTERNFEGKLINYAIVTDEDAKQYTYIYEDENGEITIYDANWVLEQPANDISANSSYAKYVVYIGNATYDVLNINISIFNLSFVGFWKDGKAYELKNTGDSTWVAVPPTYGSSITNIKVMEKAHYERGKEYNTNTKDAIDFCDSLNNIENEMVRLNDLISGLKAEKTKVENLEKDIAAKEIEKNIALENYNKQKEILTNPDGMNYAEIEEKIDELNDELNGLPSLSDLKNINDLKDLMSQVSEGNIDVLSIVDTINNLNVGLNYKKELIIILDEILANNYNKAKQKLIDVAGEDLENISNILKDITPLINDVAETNIKLLEEKAKYELAKSNYNALLNAKELVLEEKEKVVNELEELERLLEENNIDLSELDAKFKEAEEALINKNTEVEIKINEYVVIENDIITKPETDIFVEEIDETIKEENKYDKNDTSNKQEDIVKSDSVINKEDANEDEESVNKSV